MNKLFKVIALFIAMTSIEATIVAQNKEAANGYPQPDPMTPKMSEYWTPQPPVVAPGKGTDVGSTTAPSDAIVLFDGKDLSAWETPSGEPAGWTVKDGMFIVVKGEIRTRQKFENFQLHIEWSEPEDVRGRSQGRGNSGVFLQGRYEVQILDNYNSETYVNGMVGSIYKQSPPLVNPMRKPGEWNVYDIIYSAPVFRDSLSYRVPPRVTVIMNGVVVQNNTTILGTTEYIGFPRVVEHGAGPVVLQDHGTPVRFRNVWIREL